MTSYATARYGNLTDAQFDCYGRSLATAFDQPLVVVWSAETHQVIAELTGHRCPVLALAWADGRFASTLASGATDGKVIVWREAKAAGSWPIVYSMNVTGAANVVSFSLSEPLVLAVGCGDELGVLTLILRKDVLPNAEQWQVKSFPAHDGGVASLSWAPMSSPSILASGPAVGRASSSAKVSSRRLVTCGADGLVIVWLSDARGDVWTREQLLSLPEPSSSSSLPRCVSWRPNLGLPSSTIICSREDGAIFVFCKDAEGLPWEMQSTWTVQGDARRLSWTKAGSILAISVQDEGAFLYKEGADRKWHELADISSI